MSSSSADEQRSAAVERSLEALVERLTAAEQTPRVRALRIEALRLRSIMANWRSIPPLAEVREAMLARVNHVVSAASDLALIPRKAPNTPPPPASIGPSPNEDERGPLSYSDEDTVVYERSVTPPPVAAPARHAVAPPPLPGTPAPAPPPAAGKPPPPPPPPPPAAAASSDEDEDDDDPRDEPEEAIAEPVDGPPQRSTGLIRRAPERRTEALVDPSWDDGMYEPREPWGAPRRGWSGGVPALPAPPPTQVEVHLLDLPDRLDERLVMLRDPASLRADAFRALRQRLATTGDPKLIVVSSPVAGEGKSTLAANLALAYREVVRGGRVLLIEANARRPSLAKLFGFDPPACVFDQLATHRESPSTAWVAVEQVPPLHVMAVDPRIKRSPTLDAVGFSLAMGKLSQAGYDYIVVDAPSILECADVNLILESVEGLVMASRSGMSSQKSLRRALERLGPANIIGGVLLDVPRSAIA